MLVLCLFGYVLFCFAFAAVLFRGDLHCRPVSDVALWLSPFWVPVALIVAALLLLLELFEKGVEAWPRAAKVMITTPILCFQLVRAKFVESPSHPAIDEAIARKTLDELGIDVAKEAREVMEEVRAKEKNDVV